MNESVLGGMGWKERMWSASCAMCNVERFTCNVERFMCKNILYIFEARLSSAPKSPPVADSLSCFLQPRSCFLQSMGQVSPGPHDAFSPLHEYYLKRSCVSRVRTYATKDILVGHQRRRTNESRLVPWLR